MKKKVGGKWGAADRPTPPQTRPPPPPRAPHPPATKKKVDIVSDCACHPCAGAMLIFSVFVQVFSDAPKGKGCGRPGACFWVGCRRLHKKICEWALVARLTDPPRLSLPHPGIRWCVLFARGGAAVWVGRRAVERGGGAAQDWGAKTYANNRPEKEPAIRLCLCDFVAFTACLFCIQPLFPHHGASSSASSAASSASISTSSFLNNSRSSTTSRASASTHLA